MGLMLILSICDNCYDSVFKSTLLRQSHITRHNHCRGSIPQKEKQRKPFFSLHEQCLRWLLGPYTDPEESVVECQNPMDRRIANGQCVNYRNATPVRMPLGMKQAFYHDMPHHMEQSIKHALIDHYGRTGYYRYHSAHRPISPDVLAVIQSVCQRFGWSQPLRFDDEVEDYVW